ncbi:hypothetical protein ACIBEJ_48725 [Nonomuraea sp. NPDC050790]|uniref:hypothetical protein n=1 Tax=Nonomuraea sp. NPDC050790 TaxID=3364371 RepID=UPI0037A757A3
METHRWLFDLARHDDPPDDPVNPDPDDGPDDDEGADQLGDKGKQALERMKADRAKARREANDAKKRADELAAKVAEVENRDKSETERAAQRAEKAEQRAQAATQRAVKSEVKALASEAFADPEDAHAFLDLTTYTGEDGDIDADAIKADLADLLERKPHLRKSTEPVKKTPRPDPSQGSRKEPGPVDYRTADKAAFDAEMAKLGVRPW